jgi:hypothetical protein
MSGITGKSFSVAWEKALDFPSSEVLIRGPSMIRPENNDKGRNFVVIKTTGIFDVFDKSRRQK